MRRAIAPLLILVLAAPGLASLPEARPEALGFDPSRLARVDDAIARAIGEKKVPGAVVAVGRRGKLAMVRAFGRRSVEPSDEPMTRDTVFDLASLTKPVATASAVMVLLERGKIRLGDKITAHLPELKGNGKDAITVEQLLRHRSGLIADNPIADYAEGPEIAWERIAGLTPSDAPGRGFPLQRRGVPRSWAGWSRRSRGSRSTPSRGPRSSSRWGWPTPGSAPSGGSSTT